PRTRAGIHSPRQNSPGWPLKQNGPSKMNRIFMLLSLYTLLLPGLSATEGPNARPPQKKAANQVTAKRSNMDACKLLTSDEIQSVQGERVEETKPGVQPGGGLRISACVFRTTTPAKAVSLALVEPSRQQPRDYWRKRFHAGARPTSGEPGASGKQKAD